MNDRVRREYSGPAQQDKAERGSFHDEILPYELIELRGVFSEVHTDVTTAIILR